MEAMQKRLQIDFSEQGYNDLEALQKRLGAKSKSDLMRDGLGVLQWLTDEVLEKNNAILVHKTAENTTKEIVFNFLERARSLGPKLINERPLDSKSLTRNKSRPSMNP